MVVLLGLLACLVGSGCAGSTGGYGDPVAQQRWDDAQAQTHIAEGLIASGDGDKAAEVYIELWQLAAAPEPLPGTYSTYFISLDMWRLTKQFPSTKDRFAELLPPLHEAVWSGSATESQFFAWQKLLSVLGKSELFIEYMEAARCDEEWLRWARSDRTRSDILASALTGLGRPDLAHDVRRRGGGLLADQLHDAAWLPLFIIAAPILGPMIAPK